MTEPPEAAPAGAEHLGRHAGERPQIVLDAEIDGDALRATPRTAGEQARLLEAAVTAEALESEHARLRGHGGLECPDSG